MAATASSLLPSPSLSRHRTALSRVLRPSLPLRSKSSPRVRSRPSLVLCSASPPPSSSPLHALIFDCDGVILESEHLHRQAYNDAFARFNVRCPPLSSEPLHWGVEFYDELQNRIGGGKPKMRWYFNDNGWPSSTISESPPSVNTDRENLIDVLQILDALFLLFRCSLRPYASRRAGASPYSILLLLSTSATPATAPRTDVEMATEDG